MTDTELLDWCQGVWPEIFVWCNETSIIWLGPNQTKEYKVYAGTLREAIAKAATSDESELDQRQRVATGDADGYYDEKQVAKAELASSREYKLS